MIVIMDLRPPSHRAPKSRVLVVDDERPFLELAKDFLELEGIEVRAITDPTQVIAEVISWRPNVPDEGDNHLVELAVVAQAKYLVSHNTRHLKRMELRFPQLTIVTPSQLLEKSS